MTKGKTVKGLIMTKGKRVDTLRGDWQSNPYLKNRQKKIQGIDKALWKLTLSKRLTTTAQNLEGTGHRPENAKSNLPISRKDRAPLNAEAETVDGHNPPALLSSQPWPNYHNT